jgi:prepilin-type N-terminal cleavage/methylation domain-containing protein
MLLKSLNSKSYILNSNSKAFTLIELIISIGILAILAGVGFINIINYRHRQDLTSTAQEIIEVLRNSQNRSLSQEGGGRWGVYFNNPTGAANDFYELFQGADYATATSVSKSVLPSNIQFDIPASGSSSTIIFSPITGLPNAGATVKISLISSQTSSSTITVNSNGKIGF